MKAKPQSPIWPYLGILACLFVLSITAPRAWDRLAHKEPVTRLLAASKPLEAPGRQWPAPESSRSESAAAPSTDREPPPSLAPPAPVTDSELDDRSDEVELRLSHDDVNLRFPTIVPPAPEFAMEVEPPVKIIEIAPVDISYVEEVLHRIGQPDHEQTAVPATGSSWPLPRVLLNQLDDLVQREPSADWARQAAALVRELCRQVDEAGRAPSRILNELQEVAGEPVVATDSQSGQSIRAHYALTRWLDVWKPAASLDETRTAGIADEGSSDGVAKSLVDVESLLEHGAPAAAWRKYLRLGTIARLAEDPQANGEERRAVARKVLDRMDLSTLTQAQRRFLAEPAIVEFANALHSWATESVGSTRLLKHINAYEQSGLPSDAQLVANDWRGLRWQSASQAQRVSKGLETHYRNANLRVALTADMLNRWLPQPDATELPVRDRIMNVPVRGWNTTFTDLSVRLVPDPRRIRIGLEADGLIASNTVSTSGPARFRNQGQSTFLVRKLLVLGPHGLAVWPAVAEADNNFNYLVSVETGFDGVPLVGSLVRGIARSQHDEKQGEARMEVEYKIATRSRDQFDAEIDPRLVQAAQKIQDKQVATLQRLGLELVPVGLSTTEERVVARVRLASSEQLGAHTPRPRAPSDSWASLQVHQSAINNAIESLDLNGRSFSIEELFAWIAKKLDRPELANQEDLPADVYVRFADQDAVRVRCEDGRAEVMFSFAELKQGRNRWHDFKIRSYYLPKQHGMTPRFERDRGTIFLEGKSLKGRPHIALRAIFSRVLSLNRDLNLIDESIANDPRLKGLSISQFVVAHGWIGLAYSPQRPAANVVRRPE
jgi:hypothetical protein